METKFDPTRYLMKLKGKDYLEVKWRLLWLRTEHPEASIETEMVKGDDTFAIFKAKASIPNGGSATGWGSETISDFGDYIEKAETKAIGRALAALGYGTQFCEDHAFDEKGERVVDAPVARPASSRPKSLSIGESPGRPSPLVQAALDQGATLEKPLSEGESPRRQAWKPNCPDHSVELRLFPNWRLSNNQTAPKWAHREVSMPSGWCAWDESDLTRKVEEALVEGRRQQPIDDEPPIEEEQ